MEIGAKNLKKIIVTSILILGLIFYSTVPLVYPSIEVNAESPSIKDIKRTDIDIIQTVNRGLISVYPNGTFKPNEKVTRGQVALMIAKAIKLPKATSKFADVPKNSTLYDGISRSYAAGFFKSKNKKFFPNDPISNLEIAVILDRMMNIGGNYKETTELPYRDKEQITGPSLVSVKRMRRYEVMDGEMNRFNPNAYVTRSDICTYFLRALDLIEGNRKIPDKPIPYFTPNYSKMTLSELRKAYPKHHHVIVYRIWKPEAKILVRDLMAEYYKVIHTPVDGGGIEEFAHVWTPDVWFENTFPSLVDYYKHIYKNSIYGYPMVEAISYNGKAFKDSPLMSGDFEKFNPFAYLKMPYQPAEKDNFIIDIRYFDDDYVIYQHDKVKWDKLARNPERIDHPFPKGDEYITDLSGALKYATGVTQAKGGLELRYNEQKIVLQNGSTKAHVNGVEVMLSHKVTVKNGLAFGPIREIVEHIGLYSREVNHDKRIEIANFPLEINTQKALWLK